MRPLIAMLFAVPIVLLSLTDSASARIRSDGGLGQSSYDRHSTTTPYRYQQQDITPTRRMVRKFRATKSARHHKVRYIRHVSAGGQATIVPNHPGCPSRSFCGCSAAIEVFGRNIRELWLASNWFKFPPASPAPGMVAVRRHHVFVIREVLSNGRVLAFDGNSGGHKTRVWIRSLAGYSVRDPRHAKAEKAPSDGA